MSAVFAITHIMAVPVREEASFEPTVGYTNTPSDERLVRMVGRAERDYRWFPVARHAGKLRLNNIFIGNDRVWIVFALPTELDYVSYHGALHDQHLTSKSYFKEAVVSCCQ